MDLATLGGIVVGFGLVLFGTLVAGLSPLDIFDLPSVFITIGGGTVRIGGSEPAFPTSEFHQIHPVRALSATDRCGPIDPDTC